jgi:hypothetical protein
MVGFLEFNPSRLSIPAPDSRVLPRAGSSLQLAWHYLHYFVVAPPVTLRVGPVAAVRQLDKSGWAGQAERVLLACSARAVARDLTRSGLSLTSYRRALARILGLFRSSRASGLTCSESRFYSGCERRQTCERLLASGAKAIRIAPSKSALLRTDTVRLLLGCVFLAPAPVRLVGVLFPQRAVSTQ